MGVKTTYFTCLLNERNWVIIEEKKKEEKKPYIIIHGCMYVYEVLCSGKYRLYNGSCSQLEHAAIKTKQHYD